jgi:hypothetical protein
MSPNPTPTLSANISDHIPGIRAHSTPIALPRPPQTLAASFKRLYPK